MLTPFPDAALVLMPATLNNQPNQQDQPGKRVTIVHSGPRLLPTLPARLGAAAAAWLTQHGCQVRQHSQAGRETSTDTPTTEDC